jgi:hypothetical protein
MADADKCATAARAERSEQLRDVKAAQAVRVRGGKEGSRPSSITSVEITRSRRRVSIKWLLERGPTKERLSIDLTVLFVSGN